MFLFYFNFIHSILAAYTTEQILYARIQYCGCSLAFTQTLCEKIDDCKWQDLQCTNITGIPQVVTLNTTTTTNDTSTNTTNTTTSTNTTTTNETKTTYTIDADFDYDSVTVLEVPQLTLEQILANVVNTTDTNSTDTTTNTTDTTTNTTDTTTNTTDTTTNTTDTTTNTTDTTTNTTDTTTNTTDTTTNTTDTTTNTTVIQEISITWSKVYVNKTFDNKVVCSQQSDENNCNNKRWPYQIFCLWKNGTCVDAKCSELDATVCDQTFFCINYGQCTSCLQQVQYGYLIGILFSVLILFI